MPRSKQHAVAKPMSIYQNYLALRRVFKARETWLTDAVKFKWGHSSHELNEMRRAQKAIRKDKRGEKKRDILRYLIGTL